MKRRSFIFSAVAAGGYFLIKEASAGLYLTQKIFPSENLKTAKELAKNNAIIVEPNTIYQMPKNPKHGDYVQLVVDQTSLHKPSSLTDAADARIINDREPLVLDSLAILKLTYDAKENNWKQT